LEAFRGIPANNNFRETVEETCKGEGGGVVGTIELFKLTKVMYDLGYTHASFINKANWNSLPMREKTERGWIKPRNALFFSKIKIVRDYDTKAIEYFAPSWYEYITIDGHHVDEYGEKDIAFATFDTNELIPQYHYQFHTEPFKAPGSLVGMSINWNAVRDANWGGVIVENPRSDDQWRECDWAVPTVAIWNTNPILHLAVFKNTGKFQYSRDVQYNPSMSH
jgi:hypothetical protein